MTEAGPNAPRERPSYWLTRFLVLRVLGLVYLAAFASFAWQALPLLGEEGLLPAAAWLDRIQASAGSRLDGFLLNPSFFWLDVSDGALLGAGLLGVALSLPLLFGFANAIQLALLWALQLSIVQIGQLWYGYGWEIQLVETGFLAIFLCPLRVGARLSREPAAGRRDLAAALADLPHHARRRADQAARRSLLARAHLPLLPLRDPADPESASPAAFHRLPHPLLQLGVLMNHAAELVAPWFVFGPAPGPPRGGRGDARLPGRPDRERESVLPQLAHDRPDPRLLRRFAAARVLPRALVARARAGGGRGKALARAEPTRAGARGAGRAS